MMPTEHPTQRQYGYKHPTQHGYKHPTQHMMHGHMTQPTMHMFTTIQQLYSTAILTAIINSYKCTSIHQQFHQHLHVIIQLYQHHYHHD